MRKLWRKRIVLGVGIITILAALAACAKKEEPAETAVETIETSGTEMTSEMGSEIGLPPDLQESGDFPPDPIDPPKGPPK